MIPCKECGALCDGEIGVCPECIDAMRTIAIKKNPNIVEMYDNWMQERKISEDEYRAGMAIFKIR